MRLIERTNLEIYIADNRGRCRDCKTPVFWCKTSRGKSIPMDFPPPTALGPGPDPTHRLVFGSGEGGWDGTVEAWRSDSQATHVCHFDTCKAKQPPGDTHDAAMQRDRDAKKGQAAW